MKANKRVNVERAEAEILFIRISQPEYLANHDGNLNYEYCYLSLLLISTTHPRRDLERQQEMRRLTRKSDL